MVRKNVIFEGSAKPRGQFHHLSFGLQCASERSNRLHGADFSLTFAGLLIKSKHDTRWDELDAQFKFEHFYANKLKIDVKEGLTSKKKADKHTEKSLLDELSMFI